MTYYFLFFPVLTKVLIMSGVYTFSVPSVVFETTEIINLDETNMSECKSHKNYNSKHFDSYVGLLDGQTLMACGGYTSRKLI